MADVFISYAKARRELTEQLAKDLEAAGLSVWWDTSLRPGENFRNEIDDQLNACKIAVIVWSAESVKSDWVIAEADHAWQQKKLINTHAPDIKAFQIPKPFNQMHSVELTDRAVIVEAVRRRVAGEPASMATARAAVPDADMGSAAARRVSAPFFRSKYGLAALASALIAVVAIAYFTLVPRTGTPIAPGPTWDFAGTTFIGHPIPFAWKFDPRPSDRSRPQSILFELASAPTVAFEGDARTTTYADGDHKYLPRINDTRFWRIRAVESESKRALSDWSATLQVTQYDSAFDRVRLTGKVLLNLSNAEIQGAFKWVDDKGFRGFDIKLARMIVDALATRMGRSLDMVLIAVPWAQLLDTPNEGRADFIISSIAKSDERQGTFQIEFSQAYFCTTHALIYRTGVPDRSIKEMLAGKIIGVQEKTTNERLAQQLAQGGAFQVQAFGTTEGLINALLRSTIDVGLVDTPFAITAQHANRLSGRNRVAVKEFKKADFPASVPEHERVEEYALAVRTGEDELLGVINGVIATAKQDGSLARLLRESTQEFEDGHAVPLSSRSPGTGAQPWECG